MNRLAGILVRLDNALAKGESALLVALLVSMTGVVFLQVVFRYVLTHPLHWSEELARYLFVWISLIGAALALHKRGHFGLDFFFQKLPVAAARWGRLIVHALVGALILVILVEGIVLVQKTALQESPAMGMSMGLAYASLPVCAGLMALHLIVILLKEAMEAKRKDRA
jgi:TRAP-type C4-dicarboxylate transport system permease small subunit